MDSAHLPPDLCHDYAEGLLDPAARRAADAHLDTCAECRLALEAARGYFAELAALEPIRAPDRFLTRVHDRIARRSPWKRALAVLSSPRFLPVPLAGLAAVLVGVYLVVAPQMRQEPPMPTVALAEPPSVVSAEPPGEPAPAPPEAPAKARHPESPKTRERQQPLRAAPRAERKDAPAPASTFSPSNASAPAPAADDPAPTANSAAGSPAAPVSEALAAAAPKAKAARAAKREADDPSLATLLAWAPERYVLKRKAEPGNGPGYQMLEEEVRSRKSARQDEYQSLDFDGSDQDGGYDDFRAGLEKAGARILRVQRGTIERYELELEPAALPRLEAYLRRQGDLASVPRPISGGAADAAGPLRMTLRVERGP